MLTSPGVIDILDPMSGLVSAVDAGGRRAFVLWRDGAVRLLDDKLAEIAQRELPLEDDVCVLAASGLDLVVLACAGGLVIAGDARAFLHPHPVQDTAILELAMGQDGVLAYRVDVEGSRLHLTEILAGDDPVIGGFSPSGTKLLVTPYPSDPETVRVLSWPDLNEISRLDASDVGAEYGFGLAGCWINDGRVAVYATEDALIVADENFDSSERLVLPIDFGDEGEIEKLTHLGSGNVAIGAWTPSGRLTLVVRLVDE